MTAALTPDPVMEESQVEARELTVAVQLALPPTLVASSYDGEVTAPRADQHSPDGSFLPVFAAALGSVAAGPLTQAIFRILSERGTYLIRSLPRWFRPDVTAASRPVLMTTTEFSHDRSKVLRRVADDRVPVMISRHGKVVAALVPVREDVFETDAYVTAAKGIRAERLGSMSPVAAVLGNLTDEELEAIKNSEDKVGTAARFGVDLSNGEVPHELR